MYNITTHVAKVERGEHDRLDLEIRYLVAVFVTKKKTYQIDKASAF